MENLSKRIKNRIRMTAVAFRSDCHFSVYYAWLRVAAELGGRLGLRRLAERARQRKDRWIMEYLRKELDGVVSRFSVDTDQGTPVPNAPIWVCWWTGEDTAPPLVKKCIRSIRANAGNHPVHLITKENYGQYLTIPDYILEKVNNADICIANFSDYLRFSLLAEYGGLWLDATIFCTGSIEEPMTLPLFTCKGRTGESYYISDYRWTSFCFGGGKGHVLFRFMKEAYKAYWKKHKYAIDYLLVDYLINLAYTTSGSIKNGLDAVEINNIHRDDLQAAMNAALPAEQWSSVLHTDTALYKLSWREQYAEKTPDRQESIYGYFLTQKL